MWWRTCAGALPSVQPNVMVIATGGNKRRFTSVAFHQFKSEDIAIKIQRALEIGDFQMDMANPHPRIDWF